MYILWLYHSVGLFPPLSRYELMRYEWHRNRMKWSKGQVWGSCCLDSNSMSFSDSLGDLSKFFSHSVTHSLYLENGGDNYPK